MFKQVIASLLENNEFDLAREVITVQSKTEVTALPHNKRKEWTFDMSKGDIDKQIVNVNMPIGCWFLATGARHHRQATLYITP